MMEGIHGGRRYLGEGGCKDAKAKLSKCPSLIWS